MWLCRLEHQERPLSDVEGGRFEFRAFVRNRWCPGLRAYCETMR